MDELINALVLCVASIVVGMVLHSAGGHAGYNQRIRDWIERRLLKQYRWSYCCKSCGYRTDSHIEFAYHKCHLDAGKEGMKRER